ncbi:MAG: type II secretion system protein GspM [Methylococcales bacterium]
MKKKMLSELSSRQQRFLALSLFILGIILVLGLIVVPLVDAAASYDEDIEDLQFKLLRYKRIVAGREKVLQHLDTLKRRQGDGDQFSNRATPALASADLQQLIKKAVVDSGGRLISTQVVPEQEEEHFIKISVKVRMSGDTAALRNVLYEIETARPMLIVDDLTIRGTSGRRDRRTRKILPSNELNVNFDVSGFMRIVRG